MELPFYLLRLFIGNFLKDYTSGIFQGISETFKTIKKLYIFGQLFLNYSVFPHKHACFFLDQV